MDRKLFPALIGPKGAKIQELTAKHGNMVVRFSDPDSGKDVVLLQGTPAQVAAAKADLQATIASLAKKQVGRRARRRWDDCAH